MRATFPNNSDAVQPSHLPRHKAGDLAARASRTRTGCGHSSVPPFSSPTLTNKTKCTLAHLRKNQELAALLKWTASKPKPFAGEDVDTARKTEENRKSVRIRGRPSEGTHPSPLPRVLTSPRESGNGRCSLSHPVPPQQSMTHTNSYYKNQSPSTVQSTAKFESE